TQAPSPATLATLMACRSSAFRRSPGAPVCRNRRTWLSWVSVLPAWVWPAGASRRAERQTEADTLYEKASLAGAFSFRILVRRSSTPYHWAMHILFIWEQGLGYGHLGHLYPIARAARAKGHRTTLAVRHMENVW